MKLSTAYLLFGLVLSLQAQQYSVQKQMDTGIIAANNLTNISKGTSNVFEERNTLNPSVESNVKFLGVNCNGTLDPGDSFDLGFSLQNTGNDDAIGLTISGVLPEQIASFDFSNLPSAVTYSFDEITRALIFNVDDGFLNAGNVPIDCFVSFTLHEACYFLEDNCDLDFEIQFEIFYYGVVNSNVYTSSSSAKFDNCDGVASSLIHINQPSVNWLTPNGALDVALECDDASGLSSAQMLLPEIDNCDLAIVKVPGLFVESAECPLSGTITNIFQVTDACGVSLEDFVQIISIQDTKAPEIQTPIGSLDVLEIECDNENAINAALALYPSAVDNCDANPMMTLVSDETTFDSNCPNAYTRIRTWSFADACGNLCEPFTQTITVLDTTAPVLDTAPQDITVECIDDVPAMVSLSYIDNCDVAGTIAGVDGILVGDACGGTITRAWNITDSCGNVAETRTQIITINDTTAPMFNETLPTDLTVNYNNIPVAETLTAIDNCSDANVQFTETIDGDICAESYEIKRTWLAIDSCNNQISHEQLITVNKEVLQVQISGISAISSNNCSDGIATATINGGVAPYQYLWSDGQTTDTASGLLEGMYSVTITDALGCTIETSIQIDCKYIYANDDCLNADVTGVNVAINGILNVLSNDAVLGNTADTNNVILTVLNFDPTYPMTIDSNGDVNIASNTPAGEYQLTYQICDASAPNNCDTAIVCITVVEPQINVVVNSECINDVPYLNYNVDLLNFTTTELVTITWTDGVNDVQIDTNQPLSGQILWPGAEIDAQGNATDWPGWILENGIWVQGSDGFETLRPTAFVTLSINPSVTIQVDYPPSDPVCISGPRVTGVGVSTDVDCYGDATGSINLSPSAGVAPYTFVWSTTNGLGLEVNTEDQTGLTAGDYQVIITDSVGDTIELNFTIHQPSAPIEGYIDSQVNVDCFGNTTGAATVNAFGGTLGNSGYNFLWSDNQTGQTATGLSVGSYTVTITDELGCSVVLPVEITGPSEPLSALAINTSNANCLNNQGGFEISVSGGTPPYLYSIDGGQSTQNENTFNVSVGTYSILITDANNCATTVSGIEVSSNDTELPTISVVPTINTEGCGVGDITSSNSMFDYSSTESGNVLSLFGVNGYIVGDDIGVASVTYIDEILSDDECEITVRRLFTATDNCGNTATAEQVLTIEDNTAPTFDSLPDAELNVSCGAIPDAASLTATDNCNTANVSMDATRSSTDENGNYIIKRTYTAVDSCGNKTEFEQILNVQEVNISAISVNAIEICIDELPIDLLTLLIGLIDDLGTWSDDDNSGGLNGSMFDPSQVNLGTYTFTHTSSDASCNKITSIQINVNDLCVVLPCSIEEDGLYISKAVTPNGDGYNDYFQVGDELQVGCGFVYDVKIFNRWGQIVFESDNYQNNWDGLHVTGGMTIGGTDDLPAGTYYYIVEVVNSGLDPYTGPMYLGK